MAAIHQVDDFSCLDGDDSCYDGDYSIYDGDDSIYDADDAVCDDQRDGLLPEEVAAYEAERMYLDLFQDVLTEPLKYDIELYKVLAYTEPYGRSMPF